MILPDKPIGLAIPVSDHGAVVMVLQNNVFIFNRRWWTSRVFYMSSLDYNCFLLEQMLVNEGHVCICQGNIEPVEAMANHSSFIKFNKERNKCETKKADRSRRQSLLHTTWNMLSTAISFH